MFNVGCPASSNLLVAVRHHTCMLNIEYLQLFNLELEKESLDRIADYSFNHLYKSRCLGASLVKSFDLLGFHTLIFIDPRFTKARKKRKPKEFNDHG